LSAAVSRKATVSSLDEPPPFLEAIPLAMYACDAAGRILWFNHRAESLWGRAPRVRDDTEERFCGAAVMQSLDGRPIRREDMPVAHALRTGTSIDDLEIIIERPDGSRRGVTIHANPTKDANGRIIGAIIFFHEAPTSQHTQNPSHDSELGYRGLLDALPTVIYTTDAEGRITFFNTAAAELWGHRPELGTSYRCGPWKLFWSDGRPMTHDECPMAITLKEKRPARGYEAIAERPDGSRFWFIPYPTPLCNAAGDMIGAVDMMVDITKRKASEQNIEILSREINHRAKNIMAVIQSIIRLSTTPTTREFAEVLLGRITALGHAHNLLSENRWESAGLERLLAEELAPYREGSQARVQIHGPTLALAASAAQPLSIAVHELATNAAKYGALSVPEGRVAVEWARNPDGGVVVRWVESEGPTVTPPAHQSFGLKVIGIVVRSQLAGTVAFDWHPNGLVCTIDIPAVALAD
jgi:PAS domain S-box-containing protein